MPGRTGLFGRAEQCLRELPIFRGQGHVSLAPQARSPASTEGRLIMTEDRIAAEADVVTRVSPQSVRGTAAKLTAMISAKGMKLFAGIDQAAGARQVGLTLRETTLVIFASPKTGAPR
jgi:hypothetical protein